MGAVSDFCGEIHQASARIKRAPSGFAWGAFQGASLAKAIGVERVSMLEFGVAGGKGLHALEKIALRLEEMYGVGVGPVRV